MQSQNKVPELLKVKYWSPLLMGYGLGYHAAEPLLNWPLFVFLIGFGLWSVWLILKINRGEEHEQN